jgi:PAS domain S-box-containing protein
MRRFLDLPFKRKLLWIILSSSTVSLLLCGVGFFSVDIWQAQRDMLTELRETARRIAADGRASFVSKDAKSASDKLLGSLAAYPHITRAGLYDARGDLLAYYQRADISERPSLRASAAGHTFKGNRLDLFEPIWDDGKLLHTIYLQSDIGDLRQELWEHGLVTLAVMLIALSFSFLLSLWVTRFITRPLDGLSRAAQSVLVHNNYSLRAPKLSEDELGSLTDVFNHMLERVQERDESIQAAREGLEARVESRTLELLRTEARTRAITDSAQDAIVMMDPEGKISYWNPAAERVLGYTSAETIGRNMHALLVPAQYRPLHAAAYPRFQQTGQGAAVGKSLELSAVRKDGVEIPIQLSLSAVAIDGAWHAVGIVRDISEQKRAEETLVETNRQLETATARSYEMTVKAEQANAAKSDFLASMSHEIRTPMNGVLGMAGLLLETKLDDEQRRFAEIVRSSADFLLALINDILDFSKVEAGRLEVEVIDFDLGELFDDFGGMMGLRAEEKHLKFICSVSPEVPRLLRGDPGRLRQILLNLASNAIKFTSEGEVSVRASLVRESEHDTMLRVSVSDSGIGIPREKQGLLFNKFSQVDVSTTRKYGGTGLGLAICRQLVQLMNGEIGVNSENGRGSEFWFTVQLDK